MAPGPSVRRSRPWWTVGRPKSALTLAGPMAGDPTLAMLRELADYRRPAGRGPRDRRHPHALDGRFIRPAPGGDLLRTPAVLPTGRNLHGFDPFRIPSAFAVQDGARRPRGCSPATWPTATPSPKRSRSCCGAPTI